MSLTATDLKNIENIIEKKVQTSVRAAVKEETAHLATKADLDRMESRLVLSMNLLERDTFSRLDEHEVRITRLEQAVQRA